MDCIYINMKHTALLDDALVIAKCVHFLVQKAMALLNGISIKA